MKIPKVSVIVPIYNVENYVRRCAESLFLQTLCGIEIIFIDDCSTDNSLDVLRMVIDEYRELTSSTGKSVRIESMPSNSGQAAVRRHGIQVAKGEYIIHCDSDDWVEGDMYETMYKTAKERNCDIVFCNYFISTDISDSAVQQNIPESKDSLISGFLNGSIHASLWNKLVQRKLYDRIQFWPIANMREDLALMIQLAYYSQSFTCVNVPFYHYYINQFSICRAGSANKSLQRYWQSIENYNLVKSFLENINIEKRFINDLTILAFYIRNELCSVANTERRIFTLFNQSFPEITFFKTLILHVPLQSKLKYIATKLHLYSIVDKLRSKI